VVVQAEETLGHFADWSKVSAQTLLRLNKLHKNAMVTLGHKVKLDLSKVSAAQFETTRRAYHRQLYTLNASYTASSEEFTKILDEANNQRMRTATTILGLRFKMKELMTADEWKALSDQMLSYSSRYQHGSASPTSGY
jgi:hypothetical protein